MKSRYSIAIWPGIAFVISAGVLLSSVSTLGGDSRTVLSTVAMVIEALPLVLVLCGIGIIIFTIFKFSRPVNRSTNIQNFELADDDDDEESIAGSPGIGSADIQVPSANNELALLADELDFDSLDAIDSLVGNPEIDNSSLITSSVNPVAEAKILVVFGKCTQAIELLLLNFDLHGANCDEIALELVAIFENEINKEGISSERLNSLYVQRNNFLFKLEDERTRLSKSTWGYVQQYYVDKIESKLFDHSDDLQRTGT